MSDVVVNYRSAVGPPDKYDVIGALQFWVMVSRGMREHHRMLDIGCGSLRGGRFFIIYLRPDRYHGIEPQADLIRAGIAQELSWGVVRDKRPRFDTNSLCDAGVFGVTFDYVLAQSIFSHAPPHLIRKCLISLKRALAPDGRFVFTYFKGQTNYHGTAWAQSPDARYREDWMRHQLKINGFSMETLSFEHPSGQTWVEARHA
jgi:SAM-dependent methyltransferase